MPFPIVNPDILYTAEELEALTPVNRIFLSPYSADAYYLPPEAFDFTLERDRILDGIMAREFALKAPESAEYRTIQSTIAAHPFLQSYVKAVR